jgi:hypothetical protein
VTLETFILSVIIATVIICTGIIAYARGYKAGVAYCMAQMQVLEKPLRELHRMTRK